MSSADLCPKCRDVKLELKTVDGVSIDRCPSCGGLLLDSGEMQALLRKKIGHKVDAGSFTQLGPALMDEVPAHCFGCDRAMESTEGPNHIQLDMCPKCKSVFLDEGELAALEDAS